MVDFTVKILPWAAAAALLCLALWVARLYRRAWRMHRLTAKIPAPAPYPLVGNLPFAFLPLESWFDVLFSYVAELGHLIKIWLGPILLIFVMDPEDLKVVLTSPHVADKDKSFYDNAADVLGNGLITLNGSDYMRHRKAITPTMHKDNLQEFVAVFSANCRELEARLDPLAESGELWRTASDLGLTASHTVCQTILALEVPGLEAERDAFVHVMDDAMQVMLYRAARPWFRSKTLFRFSSEFTRYYKVANDITKFTEFVLMRKMKTSPRPQHRQKSFLDMFLTSPEASSLTREELLEELKTILVTGIVTSLDFLGYFLLCISWHEDFQRRAQQELDDVLGPDGDRDITAADLPHLTYLECVLKETLRIFPPAPLFGRTVTQDVELPSGQVIPEGCTVAMTPLVTHRDPRHYPDPERFDPERFTPDNSRNRHPYAFIPFSAGMRSCIGQRYAMMFGKTVAASLLRRYDVLPDPDGPQRVRDVKLVMGVTLTVKGGINVRLRRRQRSV